MVDSKINGDALWVLTPNGLKLAERILHIITDIDIYISKNVDKPLFRHFRFQSLNDKLRKKFNKYGSHIFIMSTGIVVRVIAPLITNKTEDPAVVVVDDTGHHAISLLSGHLGGANDLTLKIADILGADPVITTATDVNRVPAIDILAKKKNLVIENSQAIKTVNMALLKGEKIWVHDPLGYLAKCLPNSKSANFLELDANINKKEKKIALNQNASVFIDDITIELPSQTLILRPLTLVAGIGCNRNTDWEEISTLLIKVLKSHRLAQGSLKCMASIDVKADEAGLIAAARNLNLPLVFFKREELNSVEGIQNPSAVVERHVGVKSVCEAAAIRAARSGTLIVPKQSTKNVTVAIARINFLLSV